jgi:tetratricopeptide (TPR) repeat protein
MTLRAGSISEARNPAWLGWQARGAWRLLVVACIFAGGLLAVLEVLRRPPPVVVEAVEPVVPEVATEAAVRQVSLELDRKRGVALRESAASSFDTAKLASAIAILEDVRAETTDMRTIAATENELGLAKRLLGESERDMAIVADAIAHYRRALTIFDDQNDVANAGIVRGNLAIALRLRGEGTQSRPDLDEAAELLRSALTATDPRRNPRGWSILQKHLGLTLLALGESGNDLEALSSAVSALEASLVNAENDGRSPLDWAETQNALANALQAVGEREWSTDRLAEALKARKNAWVLYQYAGLDRFQFYFETRIALLEKLIEDRATPPEIVAIGDDTVTAEDAPL